MAYENLRGCQTIDKFGQLLWVWFGCRIKSADEIVEQWHTWLDDEKWQTMKTPTLLGCFIFWRRNNIKRDHMGPPSVTRQVS